MYVFRAYHLVLDNKFVFSTAEKGISLILNPTQRMNKEFLPLSFMQIISVISMHRKVS